jgi:hypothetical protein
MISMRDCPLICKLRSRVSNARNAHHPAFPVFTLLNAPYAGTSVGAAFAIEGKVVLLPGVHTAQQIIILQIDTVSSRGVSAENVSDSTRAVGKDSTVEVIVDRVLLHRIICCLNNDPARAVAVGNVVGDDIHVANANLHAWASLCAVEIIFH